MLIEACAVAAHPSRREQLVQRLKRLELFEQIHSTEEIRRAEAQDSWGSNLIVFQDLDEKGLSGLAWLARLSDSEDQLLPTIIVLTHKKDRSGRILALELGASDSIDWSISDAEFKARVNAHIRRHSKFHQMHLTRLMLTRQTLTDSLTGLGNRNCFNRAMDQESARSRREKKPFSLLMLDLDYFKRFNDLHGHQAGDMALRTVSRCIRAGIRNTDVGCRFGGEEFAIILPATGEIDAFRLAERIRRNVEQLSSGILKRFSPISISIGIRCLSAEERLPLGRIVRDADQALYSAKAEGRNRSRLYGPHEIQGPIRTAAVS